MAFDLNRSVPQSIAQPRVEIQSLMRQVYMWMTLGLLVTTGASFLTLNTGLINVIVQNPIVMFGAIIGELVLVIALSAAIRRLSTGMATGMFFVYAALNGFTLSIIFLVYELGTITLAFGTTVILFFVMTMIAYTTNIDLTKYGSYFMMALIGLIVAMVVNMFVGSGTLDFIISAVGVLLFTGLIAYDTQKLHKLAQDPEIQANGEAALMTKVSCCASSAADAARRLTATHQTGVGDHARF
jgi:FtsH-binding integral membrane protein